MKTIKFFAIAACAALLAVSCNSNSSKVAVEAELPSAAEVDSVSYLLGVNIGSFFKGNGFAEDLSELNMSEFKKGIVDFLKAEGSPYDADFGAQFDIDPNEMQTILSNFLTKKQTYQAAVNLAEGKAFLAKNALKADVDTTASAKAWQWMSEQQRLRRSCMIWRPVNALSSTVSLTHSDASAAM